MALIKKYHNLYQIINDFNKLTDISTISSKEFDLSYRKTDYDVDLGRFVASDEDEQTIIDNKINLGSLYIEEFLNDFSDYWVAIDKIVLDKISDDFSLDKYYNIKLNMILILKNWSIYKGTKDFIEFVFNLYSVLTTTEFWNLTEFVVESHCSIFSNFKNLEYNLTGDLPNHIWESVIKPTIHPSGWICNYRGVENIEDYSIVSFDNHLRNDICYIDYASCNSTINNITNFDSLTLTQTDLNKINKINFQFDLINISNET